MSTERKRTIRRMPFAFAIAAGVTVCSPAFGWGNEGHEAIALIARHYIEQTPGLAAKADALLAGPNDPEVDDGFAGLGTWADRYRDSSTNRKTATRQWHFVDVELDGSNDKSAACFGNALPAGVSALPGIPNDCVVNKINQFERELRDPATDPAERKLALLFLLHFIGDVHQPLHAADNHDAGGNNVFVVTGSAKNGTNLHSYWDSNTVRRLGSTPQNVADALIGDIDASDTAAWASSTAADPTWAWADESFAIATDAYSKLPKKKRSCKERKRDGSTIQARCVVISDAYAIWATGQARRRLQMAGVRLAAVIREALQ
jgi:S1/P1 Nuclease